MTENKDEEESNRIMAEVMIKLDDDTNKFLQKIMLINDDDVYHDIMKEFMEEIQTVMKNDDDVVDDTTIKKNDDDADDATDTEVLFSLLQRAEILIIFLEGHFKRQKYKKTYKTLKKELKRALLYKARKKAYERDRKLYPNDNVWKTRIGEYYEYGGTGRTLKRMSNKSRNKSSLRRRRRRRRSGKKKKTNTARTSTMMTRRK